MGPSFLPKNVYARVVLPLGSFHSGLRGRKPVLLDTAVHHPDNSDCNPSLHIPANIDFFKMNISSCFIECLIEKIYFHWSFCFQFLVYLFIIIIITSFCFDFCYLFCFQIIFLTTFLSLIYPKLFWQCKGLFVAATMASDFPLPPFSCNFCHMSLYPNILMTR